MPAQILVVDDEPSVLAVVARALREDGHDVITVSNSQVAYDVAKNQAIDVVITNSSMPGFTGTEPVTALRNLFPNLPVLHLRDHPPEIGDETAEYAGLVHPAQRRFRILARSQDFEEQAVRLGIFAQLSIDQL